jgi:hypothetical protein
MENLNSSKQEIKEHLIAEENSNKETNSPNTNLKKSKSAYTSGNMLVEEKQRIMNKWNDLNKK